MRKKRVLTVFLTFILIFTAFPLQAQASNVSYSTCSVNFRNMYQWMAYTDVDVPGSLTATGFIQGDCKGFKIRSKQKVSWEENSVITASIKITAKRYKNMKAVLRFVNDNGNSFQYNATFKDGTCSYSGSVSNKITDYYVEWELTDFEYNTADEEELTTSISFEQFRMKVESEQTGFFSNVANWFKELFEKLQNGLASIGQWFKDLGNTIVEWFKQLIENIKEAFTDLIDNVKQFFSDLTKNLKEWFSNIGQWFKDIGDRISGFFSELWQNITIKIENITDSIKEWWQSVVDWFHALFTPEDGYMEQYKVNWQKWLEEHLGFLYQSYVIIDDLFDRLSYMKDADLLIVSIPELKLPWNDMVILKSTEFNINEMLLTNSTIKMVRELCQSMVVIICFVSIVYLGKRKFEQVLVGREL